MMLPVLISQYEVQCTYSSVKALNWSGYWHNLNQLPTIGLALRILKWWIDYTDMSSSLFYNMTMMKTTQKVVVHFDWQFVAQCTTLRDRLNAAARKDGETTIGACQAWNLSKICESIPVLMKRVIASKIKSSPKSLFLSIWPDSWICFPFLCPLAF